MLPEQKDSPLRSIQTYKIIYPIFIGLGVVGYMLYKEFDPKAFEGIHFSMHMLFWLLIGAVMMLTRDIGYVIRLKILANNELSWKQAINIVLLWEFTSAVTPSAIGGTSVAILFVNKEGLSVGKSSAVVMATSFLDELYFILMFPILLLLINVGDLFAIGGEESEGFRNAFFYTAVIGYTVKFLYMLVISYGLFRNPRGLKWLLLQIFRLPVLRRWRYGAHKAGTEIIESSKELRKQPFMFWVKAFIASFLSWTSRYWVVNMLLVAFAFNFDHFLVFARQLVMWIMMLVSPTPGGSGFAEYVFKEYLGEFISPVSLAIPMAFLWRLLSYYPYLIVGVFILPNWIKKKFHKHKIHTDSDL